MNRLDINDALDYIEPTDRQKYRMYQNIINSSDILKKNKQFRFSKVMKLAASFALVLCLAGTVAYASGILDGILGYFSIENNFVSWATHKEFLKSSKDNTPPSIEDFEYDEVHSYDTIDEALLEHDLIIALPNSELLSFDKYKPTVSIINSSIISQIVFDMKYNIADGLVEISATRLKADDEISVTTSQFAENSKTNKYETKDGAVFTLLEMGNKDYTETAATTMINLSDMESYLYSIIFTDVAKSDIEKILDSMDMTIYVGE